MDTPSTISLLSEISDATEEDIEELQPSLSCASISTQIQNVHPNINQWRDCYSAWQQFDLFRKADLFTDIEVKVKDYSFKAHKAVLSACSEYFKALFTGEWPSKKVLVYEEIKPEIMKQIIEWAYTREVKVDSDNVTDLLPTADRFGCTAIVKSCSDLLNSELSAENCLGIRAFALFYFQNELFKAAESFTLRNFEDVSKTSQEFFDIEPPVLYEFLASDELNVRSEEIAFEALMTWVTAKEEDRKDMLANMLQSIRMGLMDPEYFMASVKNHSLIHNNPKVRPIVNI